MPRESEQDQQHQTQLQNEYPAGAESSYNETQGPADGADTRTDVRDEAWRPADDPAIEQAGGTTSKEEEPGRSDLDGKAQGSATDTEPTLGNPGR